MLFVFFIFFIFYWRVSMFNIISFIIGIFISSVFLLVGVIFLWVYVVEIFLLVMLSILIYVSDVNGEFVKDMVLILMFNFMFVLIL